MATTAQHESAPCWICLEEVTDEGGGRLARPRLRLPRRRGRIPRLVHRAICRAEEQGSPPIGGGRGGDSHYLVFQPMGALSELQAAVHRQGPLPPACRGLRGKYRGLSGFALRAFHVSLQQSVPSQRSKTLRALWTSFPTSSTLSKATMQVFL